MCASPFAFLRAGPPPPKVALLPDALFFTRLIGVETGATPPQVSAAAELALEGMSPFPVTQLYYGCFHVGGATEALVFAAYRRRFTAEQTAAWAGAQVVLPVFATVLAANLAPGTTVILRGDDGITGVHWEKNYPSRVLHRPLPADSADDARAVAETELIAEFGGSKKVVVIPSAPVAEAASDDQELRFRVGDLATEIGSTAAAALDVRDKSELADLRRARVRDLWLWRTLVGASAAIALLLLGEIGLLAGNNLWQQSRLAKVRVQRPLVDKIMADQSLANSIDELANKPLLPFEMVTEISGERYERKPPSIQFTRLSTTGLDKLIVEGQTHNVADISVYQATLEKLPTIDHVDIVTRNSVGDLVPFQMTVTFKPGALRPAATAPS